MITRRVACLILFCAALFGATQALAETAAPIRIGATVSLTGEFALLGKDQLQGMQMWADDVNRRGALLGRKVKIVYYDDASDPGKSAQLYERLITTDKVDLLLGPYSSDLTYAASEVAERYQIPMVATGAAASKIWSRGFRNIFQIDLPADSYMDLPLEFARQQGLSRVALVHSDAEFPREVAAGARRQAAELGMQVVFDAEYPLSSTQFGELARGIGDADAEMLIGGTYLQDSIALVKALEAAEVQPKIVALTVGPAQRSFGEALGDSANNVIGVLAWMRSGFLPLAYDFSYRYKSKYGGNAAVHAAYGYAGGQVLEAGVRLAGSLDYDAIREQLRTMTFRSVLGRYRVDDSGAQTAKNTYVMQWQSGLRLLILPEKLRDAPVIYPFR